MADAERFNPFPGLRSFEPEEDYLFFGRDAEIDELLRRLRVQRFLAVLGTSGSGKSSLVRSGLIPSLHSGAMTVAGSSWRVALMRPGEDPIGHLAAALDGSLRDPEAAADEELANLQRMFLESTLRASDVGLTAAVRQARLPADDNLLVVVDQFEELFRFKGSRAGAGNQALAFVNLLLEAARQDGVPIYVTLTMRSDFIGHSMEFPGLPEAINEGLYLIPRMTRAELRAAITGPVAVGGGEISSGLVLGLINDVGDDPDQLPVLQHALMRTWDYWQEHREVGEPLDLGHYRAVGTMREALSRHAEEAYGELAGEDERRIAEILFKALTDQAAGVRRPCRLEEICALAGAEPEAVVAVVERFRRGGRSFLMPPAGVELERGSILDISHESLMRLWGRLVAWSEDEARSAQFYRRLSRAAGRHREGTAGLWRSPELDLAAVWRREQRPTAAWAARYDRHFERAMAFLDDSQRARDAWLAGRERKRRITQWAVSALAAIFALLAAVMAFQARRIGQEAERANREAATAEQVSEFMVDLFKVSDPGEARGNSITAREILDRGAEEIAGKLADQPLTQARLMHTMGKVYRHLGLYPAAIPLLESAVAVRRRVLGDHSAEVAESLSHLGLLLEDQGERERAETAFSEALAIQRELHGDEHPEVAFALDNLAGLFRDRGDFETAEPMFRQALAIRRKLLGDVHAKVADSINNLAILLVEKGDWAEAESLHREALAIYRETRGDDHPSVASSLSNLAGLLFSREDYEAAAPLFREVLAIDRRQLGEEHPYVAMDLHNLAISLSGTGDDEAAERLFREALALRRKLLGDGHAHVATTLQGLARVQARKGDVAAAEALYREALVIFREALGDEHFLVGVALADWADLLLDAGREVEAHPLAVEGAQNLEQALPAGHWRVAVAQSVLGASLAAYGRFEEAEPLLIEGYRGIEAVKGAGARTTREALERLIELYEAWEKPAEAQSYRDLRAPSLARPSW